MTLLQCSCRKGEKTGGDKGEQARFHRQEGREEEKERER
jgi:hypothetical protein